MKYASLILGAILILLSGVATFNFVGESQNIQTKCVDSGRTLFYSQCAPCHEVFKNRTGPALAGADRRITKEMYYAIIANTPSAAKKYPYFRKQIEIYQVIMPAYPDMKREQIDCIIEFVKAAEKNPKLDFNPNPLKESAP